MPFFKRYFLGGSTSLRGWGRYEVSPLTERGQPIGGLTVVEGSTEARIPIGQKLSAVGFVDFGSVGRLPWKIGDDGLRVDVGPGLRYDTPIGPVRARSRLPAQPDRGPAREGAARAAPLAGHISIGQAF